jgi:hypothetical protein
MTRLSAAFVALLVVACAAPAPTPTATPTVAPTPTPTAAPALDFPDLSEQPLAQGRYDSQPPFGLAFTFEVIGDDWVSAHLHEEFFDIMKLEEGSTSPYRWIAWGLPTALYGATDAPASELAPQGAAELLAGNPFVDASEIEPINIDGEEGARLDLRINRPSNVPIFGGPAGDFGLDGDHELRLGIVQPGDDLLLVLVLARNGELEAAWTEALPIIDSMDL